MPGNDRMFRSRQSKYVKDFLQHDKVARFSSQSKINKEDFYFTCFLCFDSFTKIIQVAEDSVDHVRQTKSQDSVDNCS